MNRYSKLRRTVFLIQQVLVAAAVFVPVILADTFGIGWIDPPLPTGWSLRVA